MEIEPLKTLLSYSHNKKQTLSMFLPETIQKMIINSEYTDKDYYLDDKIYCIRRDNLQLEISGKLIWIDDEKLGIKLSSVRNQMIKSKDYYTFVQAKKQVQTQRKLMEQLMKQLQEK